MKRELLAALDAIDSSLVKKTKNLSTEKEGDLEKVINTWSYRVNQVKNNKDKGLQVANKSENVLAQKEAIHKIEIEFKKQIKFWNDRTKNNIESILEPN